MLSEWNERGGFEWRVKRNENETKASKGTRKIQKKALYLVYGIYDYCNNDRQRLGFVKKDDTMEAATL